MRGASGKWLAAFYALVLGGLLLVPGRADATVGTTANLVTAEGNGSTTAFSYNFPIPSASDAVVSILNCSTTISPCSPNTTTVLGPAQYTITGVGSSSGGTVTPGGGGFTYPLPAGYYLTISRVVPLIQATAICNYGPIYCSIESALDYLTYIAQQIQTEINVISAEETGVVVPLPLSFANGGFGFNSGISGGIPCFPSSTSVASSNDLTVNAPVIGGGSSSCVSSGTRTGTTTNFVTQTGSNIVSGDVAIGDGNGNIKDGGTLLTTGGFINLLRNASLAAWFHGCVATACTITTSGAWCAEGVWVVPTGASVTCQRETGISDGTGAGGLYSMKITGAASVSDVTIRLVLESMSAQTLAQFGGGHFQFAWENNSGSSITPTIETKYPSAQDNWGSSSVDITSTLMTSCPNGSTCLEPFGLYTVSSNAVNGYEVVLDFGNNFGSSGDSMTLGAWFDLRAGSFASAGNSAYLEPEVRDPASDIAWCQRFYQTSYDNGVAPGTSTVTGIVGGMGGYYNGASVSSSFAIPLGAPMRADPSVSYWDSVGNSGKVSKNENGTWTNNLADISSVTPGERGLLFFSNSPDVQLFLHYAADATIVGG